MKKIIGLGIAVAVIIALVTTGTWAFFSDTEESTGNVFTAGTIDLEVNDDNPWTATVDGTLKDVKPCEVRWVTITLENVGTNPMDVWKHIEMTGVAGGDHPESEKAEDSDNTINDIDGVIRYDLTVDTIAKIEEIDGYTISDGTHQLFEVTTGVHCFWIYLGTIAPGGSMTVEQSYHMDGDTTNWAQGDEMTFTIEFFAQQTVGNPPPPGTELPGYGKPIV